jgi:putative toxin-antitoxin system antitoxin component (TIGR02293 family)
MAQQLTTLWRSLQEAQMSTYSDPTLAPTVAPGVTEPAPVYGAALPLDDRLAMQLQVLLGLPSADADEWALANAERAAMSRALLDRLVSETLLPSADVQRIIPRRTWVRRKGGEPLTTAEFDGLFHLVRVQTLAELVFGDQAQAHAWLRQPKQRLGGRTPMDYASDALGAEAIERWLHEIDQGFFG